ncbi:MAG TPA: hypothetical protein VEY91_13790 [Candidatus Limnocylindria bacterium]|nr:hypothetical protein [Candidatus Limnocylindria bacterium]
MRRAVSIAALSLISLVLFAIGPHAQSTTAPLMNGIGLIDYSHPPDWQVGSWVQYKMVGSSERGNRDDFTTTLLIAGEEVFWGDTCFWLETWTEHGTQPPRAIAMLMSYSVFDDSMAWARFNLYVRKYIATVSEEGVPRQDLFLRGGDTFKSRKPIGADRTRQLDTLGIEKVVVPAGEFQALKVRREYWGGGSVLKGDSTVYDETREKTTSFFNGRIPITRLVMQDLETIGHKKTWLIGQSQDAPMQVIDHGTGQARVVGYGSDTTGILVPDEVRRPIARRKAAAPAGARKRSS